ncbi:hypothetical protein LTR17_027609, partial [Elasticomyces elasticus]
MDLGSHDQELSAFEARITPASPKRVEKAEEKETTTLGTERRAAGGLPSFTPAGSPMHNVSLEPPVQESLRSPSP